MKTKRMLALVLALLMLAVTACAAPAAEEPAPTEAVAAEPTAAPAPAPEAEPAPAPAPEAEPAPAPAPEADAPAGPVTVTATDFGFGGPISVTLTVEDGKIIDAEVVGDGETMGIGSRAVEKLPAALVEAGVPEVDGVSGATVSSGAILRAAAAAYAEAVGEVVEEAAVKMKPGTYTITTWGYSQAWSLPVTVTVSETAIEAIEVPDEFEELDQHGETWVIFRTAVDYLIPRMLEAQSFAVDAVCGATATSNAIKYGVEEAIKEALTAAGTDLSALEAFRIPSEKTELGVVEEITVDVLGVGLGNAGIMAATHYKDTMAEKGVDKISYLGIEKAAKLGGQSGMAHELFIINPQSMMDLYNNGEEYLDAEELRAFWIDDMTNADGVLKLKEDVLDLYIDRSGELIDWLYYDHGYEFEAPKVGDLSAAAGAKGFVGTFNLIKFDLSYEIRRKAVLEWQKELMAEVEAAGGSYMLETEGYELMYDAATGAVTGAKARDVFTGKEYVINAKAVIMATGGFGGGELTNTLYSNEYYPLQGDYKQFGMAQNDGKMIQAAIDIGASTWNIGMPGINTGMGALGAEIHDYPVNIKDGPINNRSGRVNTWSINDIPEGFVAYTNRLFVGPEGNRLYNEYNINNSIGNEPSQYYHAGATWFVIIDEDDVASVRDNGFPQGTKWRQYTSQGGVPLETPMPETYEVMQTAIDMGLVFKADTIEGLAEEIGCEPATLRATFDRYNELCEKGVDEDFGKDPALLEVYGEGPYYAVQVFSYPYGSCGGLNVDTQVRVLSADGETPIYGLYACGGDSLGVLMSDEKNYSGLGGPANGWCYFSGYIAGESVASYILGE